MCNCRLPTTAAAWIGRPRKRFSNLFSPAKEEGRGTGLGLATVYGIVKQNNGAIAVASEPLRGTTFRIFLPRVKTASKALPTAKGNRMHCGTETILLVEDETVILEMAAFILEQHGYTVLVAQIRSGPGLVRRRQETIDLLLTDVIMPDMNGRELSAACWNCFQQSRCCSCPGTPREHSRHGGGMNGASLHFLEKPFSASQLVQKGAIRDRSGLKLRRARVTTCNLSTLFLRTAMVWFKITFRSYRLRGFMSLSGPKSVCAHATVGYIVFGSAWIFSPTVCSWPS